MTRQAGRRLALNAERLAELSTGELREVVGGITTVPACGALEEPRHPSDRNYSLCHCLTRTCP